MKLAGPVAALLLATLSVSEAQTPKAGDQLLGKWMCESNDGDTVIKGPFTYLAGGKSTMETTIAVSSAGIEFQGTGNATWTLLPNGKLEEVITDFKVASGKSGGQPVPAATFQPMIDQGVVNQKITSDIKFADKSFVSTDDQGTVTTCKR